MYRSNKVALIYLVKVDFKAFILTNIFACIKHTSVANETQPFHLFSSLFSICSSVFHSTESLRMLEKIVMLIFNFFFIRI